MNHLAEKLFGYFDTSQPTDCMRWVETLTDGTHVLIRPLEPSDGLAKAEFETASPNCAAPLYLIGQVPNISKCFSKVWSDGTPYIVFGAFIYDGSAERMVGIGEFCTFERGLRCRCTVLVEPEWRNKGLGVALMRPLVELGKARGMHAMHARCRSNNAAMIDLAHQLGFRTRLDVNDQDWLIHELGATDR